MYVKYLSTKPTSWHINSVQYTLILPQIFKDADLSSQRSTDGLKKQRKAKEKPYMVIETTYLLELSKQDNENEKQILKRFLNDSSFVVIYNRPVFWNCLRDELWQEIGHMQTNSTWEGNSAMPTAGEVSFTKSFHWVYFKLSAIPVSKQTSNTTIKLIFSLELLSNRSSINHLPSKKKKVTFEHK